MSFIIKERWRSARAVVLAMGLSGCAAPSAEPTGCAGDRDCATGQRCDAARRCVADPIAPGVDAGGAPRLDPKSAPSTAPSPWLSEGGGSSGGADGRQLNFTVGGGPAAGDCAAEDGRHLSLGQLLADTY